MIHVDDPWRSEVELDAEVVLALLREQFPRLGATTARYLHEGWDNRAFVVDKTLIFRFPKRGEVDDRLRCELAILSALAPLSLSLQIPRPEWIGRPCTQFPFSFMGYRMIDGIPGDCNSLEQMDSSAISAALGSFLSAVHGSGSLAVAGLPIRDRRDESPALGGMRDEVGKVADKAVTALSTDILKLAAPYLNGTIALPPQAPHFCLVHDDLQAEHILVNSGGRITGIIDWGDAGIGDPTADFAGLYVWLGADAARHALDSYSAPTDTYFWDRIIFRARCLGLIAVGWAVHGGNGASLETSQAMVQRAFMPVK